MNKNMMRRLVAAGLLLSAVNVHAEVTQDSEYQRRLKVYQTIQPHGDTPFGEQVNLYTGALTFQQTDVVLEGNGPSIAILREVASAQTQQIVVRPQDMGDWELAIPRIETVTDAPLEALPIGSPGQNWVVGPSTDPDRFKRCTKIDASYSPRMLDSIWWNGMDLITEDGNRQPVLRRAPVNTNAPSMTIDGQPGVFPAVTLQNWQIGCVAATANSEAGEAFLAVSPAGLRYRFDYLVGQRATTIYEDYSGTTLRQPRMLATMYATRVEDRFGNWVQYHYTGDKLTSITASDGRSVSIAWNATARVIDSISVLVSGAPARTWTYTYANLTTAPKLSAVTLPDASAWTFSLGDVGGRPVANSELSKCTTRTLANSGASSTSTVTHPSGLVGQFTMTPTWHARSYVGSYCHYPQQGQEFAPYDDVPPLYGTYSLTRKEFSGPGLASQVWTYAYPAAVGSTSYDACASSGTCADTVWVDVTDPAGDRTRYTHSNRWDATEGKLLRTDAYEGASTLLRSDIVTYAAPNTGPYPAFVGGAMIPGNYNGANTSTWMPTKKRETLQQGVTFTWQADTFDAYANPLATTRSSTLGYARHDVATYHHNTALWVISQPASSTNTDSDPDLVESQTDYDANAMPWKTYVFGKLQQTLTYDTASAVATGQRGTLSAVADGNNHATTFGTWKRGIPQTMGFADATGKSAAVDDLGQIASVTDENGAKTCYGYDAMGRINLIRYPSETQLGQCNQDNWLETTISFAPSASPVYGLPANHWRRYENTGNARKVTFYDAMWRPVVQEVYDIGNTWNTITQTVTRYDSDGRVTYASYPQRNSTPAVYNTWANPAVAPNALGTWTAYDALGRPTQVQQNSELGLLTATTEYLSGFQTRTTNPRNKQTTTSYRAYDQPSTDWPAAIAHPQGAYTDIVRDVFGKPTQFKRRNATSTLVSTRAYVYDSYQRLCKTLEPESGAMVLEYDNAGNVSYSAAGLTLPSATDCNRGDALASNQRVDRSYDARNRLQALAFHDGRGNQSWEYWPDGLAKKITTYNDLAQGGMVENNYVYNQRRLLTGETQAQPSQPTWGMGYTYSTNAALATLVYPSGLSVNYAPNAIGQPTQAGAYATGVSYYPNGGMQQFTYGNGIVHTLTQNARQLPDQSIDSGGVLNDSYDYDANGNVAAISDGLVGARGNRSMDYDDLDRLIATTSPMYPGGAVYEYDVLDNLTRAKAPGRDHYYCYDPNNWRLTNVKTGGCGGASVIGLDYDVQGNLAQKNSQYYLFDYGNRLRDVPGKETYRYDGYGRRVSSTAAQGAIYSLYDQGGALRAQRDERKGEAYDYISLNGSLLARVTDPNSVIGVPTLTVPASSSGSYTVQWTASSGATRYDLQESFNGGAWQAAYTGTATSAAQSGKPNGRYDYRVHACKNVPCGGWSAIATVLVNIAPGSAPTLTAPATAAFGNYTVGWTAVLGADNYVLEENVGGTWSQAYNGTGLSKAYVSKAAGTYGYRVKACNPFGCSAVSATANVQTIYPPAPPVLSLPATSYNGNYTVSWAAVSGATSYELEESVNGGAWTSAQNSAATSKAYTGKADGGYSYRAKACNTAGCSAVSSTASITVLTPPTTAPTVTAPAANYTGSYTISWNTVAKATSYTLYMSVNGGAETQIYSGAGTSHNVSGQGAASYTYRVLACNGAGCANWSAPATTQVQFAPAMPASLTGNTTPDDGGLPGSRNFYLYWGSVSGATYYDLQQSWTGGTSIIYSGPNTDSSISGKGTRTFNVRACNPAGCSAWKGPLVL